MKNDQTKTLGIIGALSEEIELLKANITIKSSKIIAGMEFFEGTFHNKNIILVKSGIGKVHIAVCTQILIDRFQVTALLNSGVAGTLNAELNQGNIVISTQAVQHDFDTTACGDPLGEIAGLGITFFRADESMIQIAKIAAQKIKEITIVEGRIASGDHFIAGGNAAKKIKEHFGEVSAVEMEGAAMAQVAYLNKIPFIILRAISDKADGTADLSYAAFLPVAAKNASDLVTEFVKLW